MNDTEFERINADIAASVADAGGENPEVCEDDVFHDVATSIFAMEYPTWPVEVDEISRREFGRTHTARINDSRSW